MLPPPMPLAAPAQLPPWLDGTPPPPPSDEELLRRQLTAVVGRLQPAPDALVRLREAIPQRRARRRRVGLAAAAVAAVGLIGVVMAQPFDSTASVQTASSTQGSDGRVGPSPGTGSSSRPGAGGWLGYTASPLPGQGGSGLLVTATPPAHPSRRCPPRRRRPAPRTPPPNAPAPNSARARPRWARPTPRAWSTGRSAWSTSPPPTAASPAPARSSWCPHPTRPRSGSSRTPRATA
ncbi:hypothetical protein ACFQZC_20320 [Streptacidiphilus monticola]